ncbi:hypothetical protein [Streptomyces sp. NPDC051162]
MTHTARTTSGRKTRADWLGVTLGWIWALGTVDSEVSFTSEGH